MGCRTRSWLTLWATILLAAAPADAQEVPEEPIPWPTPEVVSQGDTVVADSSSLFVYTRNEMERLRARQRNDSIRLAQYGRDTLNLQRQLRACRTEVGSLQGVVATHSMVISRLKDVQPSLGERLVEGLAIFGAGSAVGAAGDCVVD